MKVEEKTEEKTEEEIQAEKEAKEKARRKRRFSKIVVTGIIVANVCFTSVVLWLFWRTGYEPTATIAAWFAFTTGELWALSRIKVAEKKEEKKHDEKDRVNIRKETHAPKKY